MRLLSDSLFLRALRRATSWLVDTGRQSLVARVLRCVTSAVGRALSSSLAFGTDRIKSESLAARVQPLSVLAFSRPYLWLRGRGADGAPGRGFTRLGAWAERSDLSGGNWLRLVGAALLGLGCGRALLTLTGLMTNAGESVLAAGVIRGAVITPALLALVGLFGVVWGPRLVPAFADSLVFRGLSGAGRQVTPNVARDSVSGGEPSWVIGVGAALCGASGLVAGLAGKSGPTLFTACVLALAAVIVLLWRPEAILFAAAAFPWLDWYARGALGGIGSAWDEGLLLLCVCLVLWGALVNGRLHPRTVPILLPTLFAFAAAVGSVVVRRVPGDVGLFALRVTFEPILFYFAGYLLFTTVRWLRWIVGVFLISSVGLALHGLYQYVTHVPIPVHWLEDTESEIATRAFSVIGNPNGLGAVLALGSLVALALLLSGGLRRSSRLALGAAAVIQLAGTAVTFSRGAWIGLAVGLFAMLLLGYRRYLLPAVMVCAVGLLAVPRVFIRRFIFMFSDTYLGRSAAYGRTYRWGAALDQIGALPLFGVGLGTFGGSAAERFDYWSIWVDSYYLQMGAEGGILLLAAFLWLLARVGKGLAKGYRVASDPFVRALAAGVFGGFVAILVASAFASDFETLAVGAAFWLLAGLATSAALRAKGDA